jgi:hypothetical protein
MNAKREPQRAQTVVIGGGQTGLSVGYHLAQRGLPFVILDAHQRVGDAWRQRWDSLRVFVPARYCGLDGWTWSESIRPGWLAGTPGHVPFRIEGAAGRVLVPLVLRVLFHRVPSTPVGRRKRRKLITDAMPMVRTKPKDLAAAGVERVGRVEEVCDGLPCPADGRTLEPANVLGILSDVVVHRRSTTKADPFGCTPGTRTVAQHPATSISHQPKPTNSNLPTALLRKWRCPRLTQVRAARPGRQWRPCMTPEHAYPHVWAEAYACLERSCVPTSSAAP